jgi:RND family efflux transporter MFP subunit
MDEPMKTLLQAVQTFFKKYRIPVFISLGVMLAIVIALLVFPVKQTKTGTITQTAYQTTPVMRGDITVTATGSGSIKAAKTIDLAFSAPGTLATLNVKAGDLVKAGDVLAVSGELDELKVKLEQQEQTVLDAQNDLTSLLSSGEITLAQALLDQADAQEVFEEADKDHVSSGTVRCSSKILDKYLAEYWDYRRKAQVWEDELENPKTGYGKDYILTNLTPLQNARDAAYLNWQYCSGYTETETDESEAAWMLAKAKMELAEKDYQYLLENNGIDPVAVEIAQAEVENAQLQLTKAQNDLAGATLVAPIDGTILSINAAVGDSVDTSTLISMADLSQLVMNVSVDESNYQALQEGCSAQIVLSAVSDRVYTGTVTQVSPELMSGFNTSVATGVVTLQNPSLMPGKYLSLGMSGTVYLTCGKANKVLLAPVTAVYQNDDGKSFVYVLNADGKPEKRFVEVGFQNASYIEITDGLSDGELIITSKVSG